MSPKFLFSEHDIRQEFRNTERNKRTGQAETDKKTEAILKNITA
jgi:hypothetical protein